MSKKSQPPVASAVFASARFAIWILVAAVASGAAAAEGAGFFRLSEENGVWWFIDPAGQKFVSLGMNHIEPNLLLSESNREDAVARYGDDLLRPNGRPYLGGEAVGRFVEEAIDRGRQWGFNTLGIHNPVPQSEMPYAVTFRPYPLDGWPTLERVHPDPFDPRTETVVDRKARVWAATRRDDHHIVGIAFASMPIWKTEPGSLHEWVLAMMELEVAAPGKQAWVETLRTRYSSPQEAGRTYGVEAARWQDLEARVDWPRPTIPAQATLDQEAFLPRIADNWYRILTTATRRHAPNHLIFGDKIVPHRDLPEWLEPIIAKYFDLIFIMWFDHADAQIGRLRELHARTGKPILSGDSSFAHPNPRVPKPKGTRVGSQAEVGRAYAQFLDTMMAEPYFVGWHHCGYMEGSPDLRWIGPLIVRQNGFVRPDGTVYEKTVDAVREANRRAFAIHAGDPASAPEALQPVAEKAAPAVRRTKRSRERPRQSAGAVIACKRSSGDGYTLTQVGARVYELRVQRGAGGVPRKPVVWILTDEGVVVFDTSDPVGAKRARELIREQTDLPIRYIIYSHHHGTQTAGARVLREAETQIVAHHDLPIALDIRATFSDYYNRLNSIQFDLDQRPGAGDAEDRHLYPDITYETQKTLSLGGVEIELHHVVGEAEDYTLVYLPEERIVMAADLLAGGIPMVASPMKRVRDEVRWRQSLQLILDLEPRALLRSAGAPYCQREKINDHLNVHIRFLDFLHNAVAEQMNLGRSMQEAVEAIDLPPDLAASPYLNERYGTLEFAVRGVYHRHSGWFDQNGSTIRLIPAERRARSFIADMGGPPKVLARARELAGEGRMLLALEYLDLLIDAEPEDGEARLEKARILGLLGEANDQPIVRNMYRRLAKIERQRARGGESDP